ncbi:MAG: hypothetical protein HRU10_03665 [Opitutales bacterium]|nr:hypothetical protein [Opitutales bacterium]
MSFEIGPNISGFNTPSYLREGQDKAVKREKATQASSAEKTTDSAKTSKSSSVESSPTARLYDIANRAFESQTVQEEISLLQSQSAALEEAFQVLERIDSLVSEDQTGDFSELQASLAEVGNASFNNRSLFLSEDSEGEPVPFRRSSGDYNVSREELLNAMNPILDAQEASDLYENTVRSASNAVSEMIGRTGAVESQVSSNAVAAVVDPAEYDLGALSDNVRTTLDPRIHGNLQPGNIPRLIT